MEDWNIRSEYIVGIKELGDDCSPLEQTNSPQRWDTAAVNGHNVEVVPSRGVTWGEAKSTVQIHGDNFGGGVGFVKS